MKIFGHHQLMNWSSGKDLIIGVNTFLSSKGSPTVLPEGCKTRPSGNVIRATEEGNAAMRKLQAASPDLGGKAAIRYENMFAVLMEATKYCSLGQLTAVMFEVWAV